MLGSGKLGKQNLLPVVDLPTSSVVAAVSQTKPQSTQSSDAANSLRLDFLLSCFVVAAATSCLW